MKLALSQHPLNPTKVTPQAGDRENWATAGTRNLANHPPEEKESKTSLKSHLRTLICYTSWSCYCRKQIVISNHI